MSLYLLFSQGVPGENGADGERGVQGPEVSLSKRTVPVLQRRVLPVPSTSAYKPPLPRASAEGTSCTVYFRL